VLAHGASRRILRPQGEQSKWGALHYAFDALREDYRQSVLWQITPPMWQANHGLVPAIWWNHLDRIMSAVHDLGCLDLID
jgi:hypothetical protein